MNDIKVLMGIFAYDLEHVLSAHKNNNKVCARRLRPSFLRVVATTTPTHLAPFPSPPPPIC